MEYTRTISKQRSKSELICRICGDIARGYNFDVITCMSCKAFFRRNARRSSKIPRCEQIVYCKITKTTRTACAECRLKKCFAYGMNPDLIRSIKTKTLTSTKMIIAKQIQLPTPRPLNLLNYDHSSLTIDQWNLLSNIIHIYDEHNIMLPMQSMLSRKPSLPIKLRFKSQDMMNSIDQMFENFIELLSHSLDLRCLSPRACQSLLSRNAFVLGNINASFIIHESNALHNPTYQYSCKNLFSDELVKAYIRDNQRFLSNGNIYKLLIFVLIFSSNCSVVLYSNDADIPIISNSIELIHIQNLYVTILWKYLLYVYGHDGAVMCFTKVIKNVLDALARMEYILTNMTYLKILNKVSSLFERCFLQNP